MYVFRFGKDISCRKKADRPFLLRSIKSNVNARLIAHQTYGRLHQDWFLPWHHCQKPFWTSHFANWTLHKVPFIYYVSTFIAQNLICLPNFSQKLIYFLSKQKNFFFNMTFWRNFHTLVWIILVHKEKYSKKIVKMLRLIRKKALA